MINSNSSLACLPEGVGVAVGGAVAGVSVLVILILLTITAVWVARKKYHKKRGWRTQEPYIWCIAYIIHCSWYMQQLWLWELRMI